MTTGHSSPKTPTPLKRALFDRGLSNRALAQMLELNETHVSRLVNGLRPSPDVQRGIAEALDMKEAELWP